MHPTQAVSSASTSQAAGHQGFNYTPPQLTPLHVNPAQVITPQNLTAGLPDPAAVAKQKDGYLRMLDDQLKSGEMQLEQQRKFQTDIIHAQADQSRKQLLMQVEQQVKTQEMALLQQFSQQIAALRQHASPEERAGA